MTILLGGVVVNTHKGQNTLQIWSLTSLHQLFPAAHLSDSPDCQLLQFSTWQQRVGNSQNQQTNGPNLNGKDSHRNSLPSTLFTCNLNGSQRKRKQSQLFAQHSIYSPSQWFTMEKTAITTLCQALYLLFTHNLNSSQWKKTAITTLCQALYLLIISMVHNGKDSNRNFLPSTLFTYQDIPEYQVYPRKCWAV